MTDAIAAANPPAPAAAPVSAPAPAASAASPAPAPAVSAPAEAPAASPAPTTSTAAPAAAPPAAPAAAPAEPAAAPPGAPEKYEFKAPEGAAAFDDTVLATYGDAARELNLTQEGAQALLTKVGPVIQAQQMAKLAEFYKDIGGMPDTWADQLKADKEIGGDNLAANMAIGVKARDLGGPEFVKLLDKTGLGNHPALVKTFIKIGRSLSEDKFIPGGNASTEAPTAAQRLYGKK